MLDAAARPMTPATSLEHTPPLVSFDRVTKLYDGGRAALTDATFTLGRSEFVLLAGPSGAGKSTVLRLICGLEVPTSGQVTVAGEDIARMRGGALAFLRRSLGVVLQDLGRWKEAGEHLRAELEIRRGAWRRVACCGCPRWSRERSGPRRHSAPSAGSNRSPSCEGAAKPGSTGWRSREGPGR